MRDFADFIRKQGVVGFAVGFILGRAISDLVGSIVNDLINPVIGIALGTFGDLSKLSIHIFSANITYGKFISTGINFILVALIVYLGVSKLRLDRIDKPKEPK